MRKLRKRKLVRNFRARDNIPILMDNSNLPPSFSRAESDIGYDGVRLAVERRRGNSEIVLGKAPTAEEARDNYVMHFDLAQVGLVHLDSLGMIFEANPMATELLDCDQAQLLSGKLPFVAQVAPDSRTVFLEHFDLALRSEEKEACEIVLLNRMGGETPVRVESLRNTRANGTVGIFITLTNLTSRRSLEQMLE